MSSRVEHTYDASVDAVYAKLTDEAHLRARAEDAGDFNIEVTITERGDGVTTKLVRDIESEIPSFAKKFVDPVNHVTDEIVWRVEGDRRVGELSVDVNARISLTGTLTLSPAGDRCRFVQDFTAKVDVPLVGGRIAKKVEEETHKAVTDSCAFTARHL